MRRRRQLPAWIRRRTPSLWERIADYFKRKKEVY